MSLNNLINEDIALRNIAKDAVVEEECKNEWRGTDSCDEQRRHNPNSIIYNRGSNNASMPRESWDRLNGNTTTRVTITHPYQQRGRVVQHENSLYVYPEDRTRDGQETAALHIGEAINGDFDDLSTPLNHSKEHMVFSNLHDLQHAHGMNNTMWPQRYTDNRDNFNANTGRTYNTMNYTNNSAGTNMYPTSNGHNFRNARFDAREMKNSVQNRWEDAKDRVNYDAREMKNSVQNRWEDAKDRVNYDAREMKNSVQNRWEDAKDRVNYDAREMKNSVQNTWEDAKDRVNYDAREMKNSVQNTYENVKDKVDYETRPLSRAIDRAVDNAQRTYNDFTSSNTNNRNNIHRAIDRAADSTEHLFEAGKETSKRIANDILPSHTYRSMAENYLNNHDNNTNNTYENDSYSDANLTDDSDREDNHTNNTDTDNEDC